MADKALDVYLNDHLAGSMLGCDLAAHLRDAADGELAEAMAPIAAAIDEDRDALLELMDRLDVSRNVVKQATAWIAEKASWVKFSGAPAGGSGVGTFMALESLCLGVEGKVSLWRALIEVAPRYPALAGTDLVALLQRAEAQRRTLEDQRTALAARTFGTDPATA